MVPGGPAPGKERKMSYKMLWETMKEALECRVDEEAEDEYKYIRLSTLLELMNEQKEAAGGKKWYNGEIGYDIPITIVGVIGALLMGAGLFALVLQVYGL